MPARPARLAARGRGVGWARCALHKTLWPDGSSLKHSLLPRVKSCGSRQYPARSHRTSRPSVSHGVDACRVRHVSQAVERQSVKSEDTFKREWSILRTDTFTFMRRRTFS